MQMRCFKKKAEEIFTWMCEECTPKERVIKFKRPEGKEPRTPEPSHPYLEETKEMNKEDFNPSYRKGKI